RDCFCCRGLGPLACYADVRGDEVDGADRTGCAPGQAESRTVAAAADTGGSPCGGPPGRRPSGGDVRWCGGNDPEAHRSPSPTQEFLQHRAGRARCPSAAEGEIGRKVPISGGGSQAAGAAPRLPDPGRPGSVPGLGHGPRARRSGAARPAGGGAGLDPGRLRPEGGHRPGTGRAGAEQRRHRRLRRHPALVARSVAELDAPQLGIAGELHGPSEGLLLPNPYRVAVAERNLRRTNVEFLQYQVVPILILVVISLGTLGAATLTVRDFERGTGRLLLVAPVRRSALMVGKL